MKQNIFLRIGESIKKSKDKKEKIKENYWKLSSIKRIDYDNHLKEIKKLNKRFKLI